MHVCACCSAALKLLATVDDLVRLVTDMLHVSLSCKGCLETNMEHLQAQTSALQSQLDTTCSMFEDIRQVAGVIHAEVTDEIKHHLSTLRVRLFENVSTALTMTTMGQIPGLPAGWRRVRGRFLSIDMPTQPGAFRSHDEMGMLLVELHSDLMGQVMAEIAEFWKICTCTMNGQCPNHCCSTWPRILVRPSDSNSHTSGPSTSRPPTRCIYRSKCLLPLPPPAS